MYSPDVEEFKNSKSATAVQFEGIKSNEVEMKVEFSLSHRLGKVPVTLNSNLSIQHQRL